MIKKLYELRLLLWWALANGLGGAIVGFLEAWRFQFLATLVLTGPIVGICQWLVLRRYLGKVRWWPIATTFGWLLAMQITIKAGVILDPIINFLYTVGGLWEVFWLNVVNSPVTLAVLAVVQWLVLRPRGPNGRIQRLGGQGRQGRQGGQGGQGGHGSVGRGGGGRTPEQHRQDALFLVLPQSLDAPGPNAGLWVLASAVGGVFLGAIGATMCTKVCSLLAVGVGLGISQGLGWLAYGVVTGVVLILFFASKNK